MLTATESTDGYTGTVPAQVAELLGWPSLTFAKHVEIADGKVKIQRQTEAGYDIVEASLPAVVSVTAGVVEPRYPSFKGIMAAKNKPVDQVTAADLGLDASQVGWAGARQEITNVEQAPARQAGEKFEDDGTGAEKVVAFLEQPEGGLTDGGRQGLGLRRSRPEGKVDDGDARDAHQGARARCARSRRSTRATDADAIAAPLGEYGATKLLRDRPRRRASGPGRGGRDRASWSASTIARRDPRSRRATTAATRSRACR